MTLVLVGAAGILLGLAAHDLAVQGLSDETPLRPLVGACPRCGARRGWLRLRCTVCGRAAWRELVVALTGGLVAVGFAMTTGIGWLLVPYLGFLVLTMALMVTDLEEMRIVDRLNLPGSIAVLVLLAVVSLLLGDLAALWRGLAGAAAYFAGALALFFVAGGRGFGAGDVKLALSLGLFTAYLGWGVLGWAVFATGMIGGALALALVATGAGRKAELPYGPAMVLGAWLAIVMVGVGAIPVPS